MNNPGRSQKIVISPCAQIQSSYHKQVRAPVDRIQEHKKLGWLFASPNHRFVINDASGRDFHQNESRAEVRSAEEERSGDDRRWVASREDFLACEFRALVAHLGFYAFPGALPGAPPHGKNSADAMLGDCRHDDHAHRPSARLRLHGREILRAARWRRSPVARGSRKPGRPDCCPLHAHAAFARLWVRSGVPESISLTSVIADTVHRDVIDHSSVVDMNVGDPDVVDAAVVEEVPTSPVSARIAGAMPT